MIQLYIKSLTTEVVNVSYAAWDKIETSRTYYDPHLSIFCNFAHLIFSHISHFKDTNLSFFERL